MKTSPDPEDKKPLKAGFAKGEFEIVGDIVAPIDVEWDAMRDDIHWDPTKRNDANPPRE